MQFKISKINKVSNWFTDKIGDTWDNFIERQVLNNQDFRPSRKDQRERKIYEKIKAREEDGRNKEEKKEKESTNSPIKVIMKIIEPDLTVLVNNLTTINVLISGTAKNPALFKQNHKLDSNLSLYFTSAIETSKKLGITSSPQSISSSYAFNDQQYYLLILGYNNLLTQNLISLNNKYKNKKEEMTDSDYEEAVKIEMKNFDEKIQIIIDNVTNIIMSIKKNHLKSIKKNPIVLYKLFIGCIYKLIQENLLNQHPDLNNYLNELFNKIRTNDTKKLFTDTRSLNMLNKSIPDNFNGIITVMTENIKNEITSDTSLSSSCATISRYISEIENRMAETNDEEESETPNLQTQEEIIDRLIGKINEFFDKFPTVKASNSSTKRFKKYAKFLSLSDFNVTEQTIKSQLLRLYKLIQDLPKDNDRRSEYEESYRNFFNYYQKYMHLKKTDLTPDKIEKINLLKNNLLASLNNLNPKKDNTKSKINIFISKVIPALLSQLLIKVGAEVSPQGTPETEELDSFFEEDDAESKSELVGTTSINKLIKLIKLSEDLPTPAAVPTPETTSLPTLNRTSTESEHINPAKLYKEQIFPKLDKFKKEVYYLLPTSEKRNELIIAFDELFSATNIKNKITNAINQENEITQS